MERRVPLIRSSLPSYKVGKGARHESEPPYCVDFYLVLKDLDVGPVVVVQRVAAGTGDVRVHEVLLHTVNKVPSHGVVDQDLVHRLVGVKRLRKGLYVGLRRHLIELRVRVAGATRAGVGDEQEVEPVLGGIVVSAPAVPEDSL